MNRRCLGFRSTRRVCLYLTLFFLVGCTKVSGYKRDRDAETKQGSTPTSEPDGGEPSNTYESTRRDSTVSNNRKVDSTPFLADSSYVQEDASDDSADKFQARDEMPSADLSVEQGCSENDALRCVPDASTAREICQDNVWKSTSDCEEGEICITPNAEEPAICVDSTRICEVGDDCSTEDVCMKSYCSGNICETLPDVDAAGRSCGKDSQGICDSYGNCVGCRDNDDCVSPKSKCTSTRICVACENDNDCDTGICKVRENLADNECVECLEREHCDSTIPTSWKCEKNECIYLPECGNGILDIGEQCDDGTPVAATGGSDWDGCGLKCQFDRVWGCEDSADGYRIIDQSTHGWVWTISHPDKAGLATCAIPCGPKHDIQSQMYDTCESGTLIPGTDPAVYTECINGACVIPCGANGSCPTGYECKRPSVVDVNHYLKTGGTDGGETVYTKAFSMCLAKELFKR